MAVIQNTLYLTTPGTVVARDHLTLRVEIEKQTRLTVPIHHLESICAFGRVVVTPPAMALCWDHQVAIHYHTQNGYLLAQVLGSGDTRYLLRRAQYAAADSPEAATCIARQFVAGKLQNARSNVLRAGREADDESDREKLAEAAAELARLIRRLGHDEFIVQDGELQEALDPIRGLEGLAPGSIFRCSNTCSSNSAKISASYPHPAPAAGPDQLPAFFHLCAGPPRLPGRLDDRRIGPVCRLASRHTRRAARLCS